LDTPFQSTMETLQSLEALATLPMSLWGVASAGDEEAREGAQDDLNRQIRDALALTSGGPVEAVKTVSEYMTGIDSYTGASISSKDKVWWQVMTRLTDIVAPIGGKVTRLGVQTDILNPEKADGGEAQDSSAKVAWLSNLLGIRANDLSDPATKQKSVDGMLSNASWNLRKSVNEWEEATGEELIEIKELEELGRVDFRNRVFDFFVQSAFDPDFDWDADLTPEAQKELTQGIDKEFLEVYFNINPLPSEDRTIEYAVDSARKVNEMLNLAEGMGVEITPEMRRQYEIISSGGTREIFRLLNTEYPDLVNQFNSPGGVEVSDAAKIAAATEMLDAVGAQYGWDTATLQRMRPELTDAAREDQQMIEAGYSKEERADFFTAKMSRKKYNFWFGSDGLPVSKHDRFTAEDAEKVQR
jgi:hypothetical protein